MQFHHILVSLSCLALAATATVAAEPANLVGNWQCVSQGGVYHDGFFPPGQNSYQLKIGEQRGAAFAGHYIWGWDLTGTEYEFSSEDEDLPSYAVISANRKKVTVKEEVLGVIGPGPADFTMVDRADTSRFDGAIVNEDTIEYTQIRAGKHALADLATCRRIGN